jgi:glycosyltransferase involved in cell wall biosynthesis
MKLSIITINRNNAEGLRKTIESVVSQTYTDFEYIIIDGASTDDSVNIIKEYADKIDYWISEPDKGIYNAMNKGILTANGEYLLFLNSGDWLYDNDVLNDVFSISPTEDIVYGNACLVFSDDRKEYTAFVENLTMYHLFDDGICHQSIFFKRELFNQNCFNENYKILSDWEFLLNTVVFNGKSTKCIKITICYYAMDGLSSLQINDKSIADERLMILRTLLPDKIIDDYKQFKSLEQNYSASIFLYVNSLRNNTILWKLSRRFLKTMFILSKYFRR